MLRWALAALLLFCATVKAYVLPGGMLMRAPATGCQTVNFGPARTCVCMACRNNLKKDKRLRNRINAFRFKKGGNTNFNRFNNFADRGAQKLKEDSDAEFMALVFTHDGAEPEAETEAKAEASRLRERTDVAA